jgi:hypothetical protein
MWFCFPIPWAPWVPEKVINIKIDCPLLEPHLGNCDFLQFFDLEKVGNSLKKNEFYAFKNSFFQAFLKNSFKKWQNFATKKSDDHFVI